VEIASHIGVDDAPEATGGLRLIAKWASETLAIVKDVFRHGFREQRAVQIIARRLGDEELAALTA
jgi:hypothetical protein